MYILKSYYPFHQLYHQILLNIATSIKYEKIQIYANNENSIINNFELIDGDFDTKILKDKLKSEIDKLIQDIKVPENGESLKFKFLEQKYYYDICDTTMLSFLDGKYCCSRLLPMLSYDNFMFVLMNILQEKSVIFLSTKLENLSIAM